MSEAKRAALRAREAASVLSLASEEKRNEALYAMANALRQKSAFIIEQNELDMASAKEKGTAESLLDRLMLNESRIESIAAALESLAALPDPLGRVLEERTLYNGLRLSRVAVPLGVVAMVYEARPNVTADAAGICIKSGNTCVLRGGSLAVHSNTTIAHILSDALASVDLPADCIVAIESTDRKETDNLLALHGLIDVLIPRGGAGLIQRCVELAQVPVIETGTGNCHVYVESQADLDKACSIILNAKTQRTGVCNACESILIDEAIVDNALPRILSMLDAAKVCIHGDERVCAIASPLGIEVAQATDKDWACEYLDLEISIKVVSDYIEAARWINRYGTGHSEAIVTENKEAAAYFMRAVDAAAVYVNASTRFTDGGEFGLGAEIGISTQKLHVRGPFALEALTTYKYLIQGEGQVRG